MIVEFLDSNFDNLLGFELTIIDFFSDWCPPCKMLAPVIKKLAEINNDVVIGKLNTSSNPHITSRFKVNKLPTIIFFKQGKEIQRIFGFQNEAKLQKMINELK